jgi:hypothetical protein
MKGNAKTVTKEGLLIFASSFIVTLVVGILVSIWLGSSNFKADLYGNIGQLLQGVLGLAVSMAGAVSAIYIALVAYNMAEEMKALEEDSRMHKFLVDEFNPAVELIRELSNIYISMWTLYKQTLLYIVEPYNNKEDKKKILNKVLSNPEYYEEILNNVLSSNPKYYEEILNDGVLINKKVIQVIEKINNNCTVKKLITKTINKDEGNKDEETLDQRLSNILLNLISFNLQKDSRTKWTADNSWLTFYIKNFSDNHFYVACFWNDITKILLIEEKSIEDYVKQLYKDIYGKGKDYDSKERIYYVSMPKEIKDDLRDWVKYNEESLKNKEDKKDARAES